jgi:hypothetical protein
MKISLVLLCAAAMAPYALGQSWIERTPTTPPTPRRAGAMAFDGTRVILHGGLYASPSQLLEETWSYNGSAWQQLTPATNSPGRWGHRLVRDTTRNRLITFGGRSPTIVGLAHDTYAWSNNAWTVVATPTAPASRYLYGMCYDQARDRVVLFGGTTVNASPNDTWEFDGLTWNQIATTNAPDSREEMVMEYDAQRGATVLFGGVDPFSNQLLGDTWVYDGVDWQDASPAISPSARYRCAAGYDSARQRVVIYGGYDGQTLLTDTYEYYAGGNWTQVSVGAGSSNSTEMYATFDGGRNVFVTFGGVGSVFSNSTWEYTGAPTARFTTFGQGCPTSVGTPSIEAISLPQIGANFEVAIGNLPASTNFLLIAEGFSQTTWNGNPLPYSLAPLGVAGCSLEVAADLLFGLGASNGSATLSLVIPNTPSLINFTYYMQAFAVDSAASNGLGGMSPAGRAVFGT